ncbi:MAG: NAD(P)/FAD-dependent oxidoreductase [Desulfobacca sp.]|uniref:NAD(P)/FAD-dependent oxidoreductase n=1 Tax=Desulfobacca sp. TaxID=2067990 RepID=UPI00404B6B14
MRIAVIGMGIAGMVAAYLLADEHDLVAFEANDYVGGHTNTIPVTVGQQTYPVDTGFIVFNEETYPNFVTLLRRCQIPWQPTNMSFSVQNAATGLEYGFRSLNGLFAQRRNLLRPAFLRLLWEIWRFQRECGELAGDKYYTIGLGEYLAQKNYSPAFLQDFLLPLGSALWSSDVKALLDFPARYFAEFSLRHRYLQLFGRIRWQVIRGGSSRYVPALTATYRDRIRLNCPVAWIRRYPDRVEVQPQRGEIESFDCVILACHSDQALQLLADASEREREILAGFPYQENSTILHTDARLLPSRRAAWASWNYYLPPDAREKATLTYHMNRLQNLAAPVEFCVTLNRDRDVDPTRIIRKFRYQHPEYRRQAPLWQKRWPEINGVNRTYFCGAYWGYGFHEDGVVSALRVAQEFGKTL